MDVARKRTDVYADDGNRGGIATICGLRGTKQNIGHPGIRCVVSERLRVSTMALECVTTTLLPRKWHQTIRGVRGDFGNQLASTACDEGSRPWG